jgi:hypothetical protein
MVLGSGYLGSDSAVGVAESNYVTNSNGYLQRITEETGMVFRLWAIWTFEIAFL